MRVRVTELVDDDLGAVIKIELAQAVGSFLANKRFRVVQKRAVRQGSSPGGGLYPGRRRQESARQDHGSRGVRLLADLTRRGAGSLRREARWRSRTGRTRISTSSSLQPRWYISVITYSSCSASRYGTVSSIQARVNRAGSPSDRTERACVAPPRAPLITAASAIRLAPLTGFATLTAAILARWTDRGVSKLTGCARRFSFFSGVGARSRNRKPTPLEYGRAGAAAQPGRG